MLARCLLSYLWASASTTSPQWEYDLHSEEHEPIFSDLSPENIAQITDRANTGSAEHQYLLGLVRLHGLGNTIPDPSEATIHIRAAAEQGYIAAQSALGLMLRHGHGVNSDDSAAAAWLSMDCKYSDGRLQSLRWTSPPNRPQ